MYRKLLFVSLLLLVLSGCGILGGVNLSSNWTGTLSGPGGSLPLTMALTQNGASITGTLSLQGASAPVSGNLAGSNLTLTVDGVPFSGTATGTSINTTGTISMESGPVQTTLAATKQ